MLYLASIIISIVIFATYLQEDNSYNDYPYTPKKLRNKGLQGMISLITSIGDRIMTRVYNHAESMKPRKQFRGRDTYCNLKLRTRKFTILAASFSAIAMQSQASHWELQSKFDVDFFEIGIDNRCSAYIFHDINNFQGPLIKTNKAIKGFGGTRTINVQQGMII